MRPHYRSGSWQNPGGTPADRANVRFVEAHDLELFAINSGELYHRHQQLASLGIGPWARHIHDKVIPLYCRQVDPVRVSVRTVSDVALALQTYYRNQAEESRRSREDRAARIVRGATPPVKL
jgi:hypothetical protein